MLKSIRVLFATALIALTSVAIAAPAGNYTTNILPKNAASLKVSPRYPGTYIRVLNSTAAGFYVQIPGTPVNDYLAQGALDEIKLNGYYDNTRLALVDPYGAVFFDQYVCRQARVDVLGQPGRYTVNIDSTYC